MRNAKLLLKLLTKRFPPTSGQRHNITLGNYFIVTLMLPERNQQFSLSDGDLDKSPAELVEVMISFAN